MTAFALLLALSQGQPVEPTPKELLGTMLSRYAFARTMSGKVSFRQVATAPTGRAEVTVETDFAMERPAKFRIEQRSSRHKQKAFLVVSDGTEFSTDVPDLEAPPNRRLVEPVMEFDGEPNIGRTLSFARDSLPDRYNPFLAVAGAWKADQMNLLLQLATLTDGRTGEIGGTACRIVKGQWRVGAREPITGTFGLWITPAGDLLKYATETSFDAVDTDGVDEVNKPRGERKPLGKITILTEWSGAIAVNPVHPPNTFRVVR